ncbi:AzlD domain-containing protein [Sinisalibacter lacisalsi]|uniref:Membrane protein n=1 Tax=Sinisalibacter lacisalsi TaxID=1526570 RepID=A0ABQ1QPS7_9RHOB|nr:AzlD domain-containing protein [Sinisalibacter lacisalsi]GGD37059.1 membrane protein [Sinisalibacter lacisalsi]
MSMSTGEIWTVIAGLAIGTFLIRFSFLGIVGNRPLPAWLLRLLRYTPVAVLPGLVAPLVLWPAATDGAADPARLLAALATLVIGLVVRNMLFAILGGAATLYTMLWLLG